MQNSRGRGPAGRKEADEARLRARREREAAHRSPGPGAYDSHKIRRDGNVVNTFEGAAAAGEQTASFKSKTQRGNDIVTSGFGSGDPGAYEPVNPNIPSMSGAGKSFNKMASQGSGGFGVSAKRVTGKWEKTDETPGAGAYDSHKIRTDGTPVNTFEGAAAAGRQTASFASKTKKLDSKPIGHDVPGVGAYDPKSPRSRTVGGDSAFKSKVDRLAKERIDGSTTAEVGPGSYQTDITRQGMPVNPFDGAASEGNGFGTSAFADTAVRDTTASLFPGDSRY